MFAAGLSGGVHPQLETCRRDEPSAPSVRTGLRTHGEQSALSSALSCPALPRPPQPGSQIVTTYDRPSSVNRDGRTIHPIPNFGK